MTSCCYPKLTKHLITITCLLMTIAWCLKVTPENKINQPKVTKFQMEYSLPGVPSLVYAGQIHYSRIPVQYWQHRILMAKAMGLNALSVYIMWNYHEVDSQTTETNNLEAFGYDYSTGNKNLPLFLELSQKHNMTVFIRPGPYVCAEWDFGGFPARLLAIPGLKLRTNTDLYLNEVRRYFTVLSTILRKYSYSNGGPIVLLQVENQYSFYGNDQSYMAALRKMWSDLNVDIPQYYVDTYSNIAKCYWPGASIGINNGLKQDQYEQVKKFGNVGFLFGGEIYSGWLNLWGRPWSNQSMSSFIQNFGGLMNNQRSFSIYMVHGGTNFGLTAGADPQYSPQSDYISHVTTYDYGAPVGQNGLPTQKYQAFRELAQAYANWTIPKQIPAPPMPMIEIPLFTVKLQAHLMENLPSPVATTFAIPPVFQSTDLGMFHQGMVLYETVLPQGKYDLKIVVSDFALVYLDNNFVTILDRSEQTQHRFTVQCPSENGNKLRILVEAMGHINFDHQIQTDFKGLLSFQVGIGAENEKHTSQTDNPQLQSTQHRQTHSHNKFSWAQLKDLNIKIRPHKPFSPISIDLKWTVTKIPLTQDNQQTIFNWNNMSGQHLTIVPSLLSSKLTLDDPIGDTYFNMSKFKKGYLWVNGHNLGRYWSKGPQQKLYCPGVWLKKGVNQIYVLELAGDEDRQIRGEKDLYTITPMEK